jgi:LacI family transcriptional regulator
MDRPPPRRVTLADVAARAGVSRATASRALAEDSRISPATRAAVRVAAAELDYVPNAAARGLRARHTRTLGLLLPDLGDPVHAQVASGFESGVGAAGYTVIIVASDGLLEKEQRALTVFMERTTDGICIVSTTIDPVTARARVAPIPMVTVQPDHPLILAQEADLPEGTIRMDEADGVRQAVGHLVDCGYRDIGYLGIGARPSNELRRRVAARTLLDRAGLRMRAFEASDQAWRDPQVVAQALGPSLPEAVLCYDDKLALALLDGLRTRGAEVPVDVAVVGYDGIPFAAISRPRLTTVATPTAEVGRLAARTLIEAIGSGTMAPSALIPVELVVRESTAATTTGTARRRVAAAAGRRRWGSSPHGQAR